MGWFILILFIIMCYMQLRKIEEMLKKFKRKLKGDNYMSKVLSKLINKKCILTTEEGLNFASSTEIECTILDVDEEWIQFMFIDKKGTTRIKILRIDCIDEIDLLD